MFALPASNVFFTNPETDIFGQCLGPETDRMCQFLAEKLTLRERDTKAWHSKNVHFLVSSYLGSIVSDLQNTFVYPQ